MIAWNSALPYFSETELACSCCGLIHLDPGFAAMLPALREAWGGPLTPTSVCRCPAWNKICNNGEPGHPDSLHLTENLKWKTAGTMAADIAWRDWLTAEKLRFARLAHARGFRVGLHDGFCHLDGGRKLGINRRPFLYGTWSGAFSPDEVL